MNIEELIWTPENEEHIAEHQVTPAEIEELFFEEGPYFRRGPGENLYHIYGCSGAGRFLFVVMIHLGRGKGYVVTARDMDKQERRLYGKRAKRSSRKEG
ncbi:MAG: hypothetical protein A2Z21_00675 [Candidatus Fraserbacteria bacterium RBG_16_55_9]|uniref:BrnT family toxin n=1 Tax=Fraserbacteria sp. (strain RBG_16_55_9) TaxID=1817864 RepID=A0A1F5UNS5_FRAXR|nr:MAG: hypothetical protein A2Z21_00675 [Candidatus Fraserbacteria bacterium RBG_16_55_9]